MPVAATLLEKGPLEGAAVLDPLRILALARELVQGGTENHFRSVAAHGVAAASKRVLEVVHFVSRAAKLVRVRVFTVVRRGRGAHLERTYAAGRGHQRLDASGILGRGTGHGRFPWRPIFTRAAALQVPWARQGAQSAASPVV